MTRVGVALLRRARKRKRGILLGILAIAFAALLTMRQCGPCWMLDAVEAGATGRVRLLNRLGVNPNWCCNNDPRPIPALQLAVLMNNTEMIDVLLDIGADIEWKGDTGMTALGRALERNHLEAFELLLRRGAASDIEVDEIPLCRRAQELRRERFLTLLRRRGKCIGRIRAERDVGPRF